MYIIMTCFQNISTTKQTHQILKILKVTSLTIPPISSYPTTCPLLASFPGISTVPQLQAKGILHVVLVQRVDLFKRSDGKSKSNIQNNKYTYNYTQYI